MTESIISEYHLRVRDIMNGFKVLTGPISKELFNYIHKYSIKDFDPVSLSKYVPCDLLYLLGDKIIWDKVEKRDDLPSSFIYSNFINFNILELNYTYYDNYNEIKKNLTYHSYSNYSQIIINLLKTKKYSIEEFNEIMKIIFNKYSLYEYNQYFDTGQIFKLFVENFHTFYNYQSLVDLTNFINQFNNILTPHQLHYNSNNLINSLANKISEFDLDYLLKHGILYYYTGTNKLPRNIINYFYNKRYTLLNGKINPFMKGLTFDEIDELINHYISLDVNKNLIFDYLSNHVIDFNTPYWFLNRYINDIYWDYTFENIINNVINLDNEMDLAKFMQFVIDFSEIIKEKCIDPINDNGTTLILPDALIIYFIDSLKKQIHNILEYQKVSNQTLSYLIDNRYLSPKDFDTISSYQILEPDFIEKYNNILNQNCLKYNMTFNSNSNSNSNKFKDLDCLQIPYKIEGEYLIIGVSSFAFINHKLNDIPKNIYTAMNKHLILNDNNGVNSNFLDRYNYLVPRIDKNILFRPLVPYNKRDKIVFNNNPKNMDGGATVFTENNLLRFRTIGYDIKPMIYLNITFNKFNVKVPVKDAIVVLKPYNSCDEYGIRITYNKYIYLPYGTKIEII